MAVALRAPDDWTAETFLATDQHVFGDGWRYELVDGRIVASATPTPARDARRRDLQAVEGAQEIVELCQAERACHVYRRQPDGVWTFAAHSGPGAVLDLHSVDLMLPLEEVYAFADLPGKGSAAEG